jgi:predicted transcriptional regulator
MITSEQIRAARALLRVEQKDLAYRAGVSTTTVRRLEAVGGVDQVARGTVEAVQRALEQAGAEFIDGGVRRSRSPSRDVAALYRELLSIAQRSATLQSQLPHLSESDLYDDRGLPA